MEKKRRLKPNPMKQGNFNKSHPWRKESYVTDPTKGVVRVRREKKKEDS